MRPRLFVCSVTDTDCKLMSDERFDLNRKCSILRSDRHDGATHCSALSFHAQGGIHQRRGVILFASTWHVRCFLKAEGKDLPKETEMDYYATMLLILIALALVLLFLLLHLRLFRTAFAFGLAVLVSLFFFIQNHLRKVIAIEDAPKKQGAAKTCGAG